METQVAGIIGFKLIIQKIGIYATLVLILILET